MKKLFLTAVLATIFTTLSSFTTISVNVPRDSNDSSGKSVIHCLFATVEIVIGDVVILEASYPTWEACRKA